MTDRPKCSICAHSAVDEINRLLISGVSLRNIATRFGVSYSSVNRHKDHIPQHLSLAKHAELVVQADNLIGDLQYLRNEAISFLNRAKLADDLRAAAPLITAACRVIETLAEVRGELDRKTEVNILINPQFQQIQTIILKELESYPDLRERIVSALTEVEV